MMDEEIRQALCEVREMKKMCGNINMKLTNIVTQRGQDYKKKLEAEYQRGLDDAWECARKLFSSMADSDIEKAFPVEWNNGGFNALINLQPQEAIAKLKAYEEKQDDKPIIGEVVERYLNGKLDSTGIYLGEDGDYWNCLFWTGAIFGTFVYPSNQFKRTGNVCDITKILEATKA